MAWIFRYTYPYKNNKLMTSIREFNSKEEATVAYYRLPEDRNFKFKDVVCVIPQTTRLKYSNEIHLLWFRGYVAQICSNHDIDKRLLEASKWPGEVTIVTYSLSEFLERFGGQGSLIGRENVSKIYDGLKQVK